MQVSQLGHEENITRQLPFCFPQDGSCLDIDISLACLLHCKAAELAINHCGHRVTKEVTHHIPSEERERKK